MANKQIYEIDLKVDGLISNFKRAISVMQQEGASNKTLSPLEKSLESIENELLRLKKVGQEGIAGDPAALKAYQQEVDRVYKKLEKLGGAFSVLAADEKKFTSATVLAEKALKDAEKSAANAQKSFAKALQGLGFDKEKAQQMAEQVKTQKELDEQLKIERQQRLENLRLAKEQLKAAKPEAGRKAASQLGSQFFRATSGSAGTLSAGAMVDLKAYIAKYNADIDASATRKLTPGTDKYNAALQEAEKRHISVQSILQKMNSELAKMITDWKDLDAIQSKIQAFSEKYFGGRDLKKDLFGSAESASGAIERAIQQRARNLGQSEAGKAYSGALSSKEILETTSEEIQKAKTALKEYQQELKNTKKEEDNLKYAKEEDQQQSEKLRSVTNNLSSDVRKQAQSNREQSATLIQTAKEAKRTSQQFEMLKSHILMLLSVTSVISIFRQQIRKTFEEVKTLDKSFASIAMVTTKSVKEMWQSYDQYANMASELGQRTDSVIDASGLFYQQGLNTAEALELTRDTMKLATLAGIDYTQATDEMTAAIRGFRMEMNQGSHVTDVYSTLAANAAASVNEIAQAMVRTSSIANSAGMSFENTAAFLTQMIETTQESAENIGFTENS